MDLSDFIEEDTEQLPVQARKVAHEGSSSFLPGRDEIGDDVHWGDTGAIDHVLQGRAVAGSQSTMLQALTDQAREANALKLPVTAGTRVSFAHNVGAVLSYSDIPAQGIDGTVVTVRSADGDVTAYDGRVHVMWDDGQFRAIQADHLRPGTANKKRASTVRMSFIEFGGGTNLGDIFALAKNGSTDLVHKATKDLWSFSENGGNFTIERLFTEDGNPLKV
jgi:hypothetical protein